jgi:hypothetical protein
VDGALFGHWPGMNMVGVLYLVTLGFPVVLASECSFQSDVKNEEIDVFSMYLHSKVCT